LVIRSQFQLPPHQPSRAEAFSHLFVSHFIESFGNPGEHPPFWHAKLPEFLTSPLPSPVKDSIRAAGMVFYGVLTRNVPIQTEAGRCYGKVLHNLHSLLQHKTLPTGDAATSAIPSDYMVVCASIMMCHFEMMASTSSDGWIHHIEAAARMLQIRGPKNCRLGLEHQMFLTVRLFMVRQPLTSVFYSHNAVFI
jgi:hypothetical protein